jgi:energy-coupling factor transporter ATP-binding protein EcfA2
MTVQEHPRAAVVTPEEDQRETPIQVRGLRKAFGSQKVLDGIDLEARRGETLAVLGRSGTGKSVLLKVLIGLQPPDAGNSIVQEVFGFVKRTYPKRSGGRMPQVEKGCGERAGSPCPPPQRTVPGARQRSEAGISAGGSIGLTRFVNATPSARRCPVRRFRQFQGERPNFLDEVVKSELMIESCFQRPYVGRWRFAWVIRLRLVGRVPANVGWP